MEIILSNYTTIFGKYNRNIAEETMQFNRIINSYELPRRNRVSNTMHIINMLLRKNRKRKRRKRNVNSIPKVLITISTWWEIFVQEKYPYDKCLENFKCSRKTYLFLIKALRCYIRPKLGVTPQRQILNMVKGVSVEKQVAIVLYKLATCADYSIMSGMFGVHKSTVHKIFYKVLLNINEHLLGKVIRMPNNGEAQEIAQHCKETYRIPQVLGAIEHIHIPLCHSPKMLATFINSENYASCILQVIVDPHHWDISVKHPGNTETYSILEDSNIYKYSNRVIPLETSNINGIQVPYKIVGSLSYPLLSWLLTKYTGSLTHQEIQFNECLDKIHNCANEAIAKLKARFIILSQSIDVSFKMAPQVVSACCVIHNICERNEDPFLQDWLNAAEEFSKKFPQPIRSINRDSADNTILNQRDAIRDYVEEQILINNDLDVLKKEIIDLLQELN